MMASLLCLAAWMTRAGAELPQIRVNSDTTQQLQNEQQVVINPTDPLNVVAAWRDFRLGYRQVGVGYSLDGGLTWTDYLLGGTLPWDSDPVLIAHTDGTLYLVVVNYQDGGANQLAVFRSNTKGMSWEGPFSAVYSNGSTFEDKEWIAVDRNTGPGHGRLVIAWSRFYEMRINVVMSNDRGQTWSAPVRVSASGASCQWPVPVYLRNGNILVAWDDYNGSRIQYDISSDGGNTWGTDRTLTATGTSPGSDINGGILVFAYPVLLVDRSGGPRDGTVYCVYPDRAVSNNGMDIWCRRSTDHGVTWNSAVRMNDDPPGLNRDQFHPWADLAEDGTLVASWYDRRDDTSNYRWHIYSSLSTDGGLTWAPNTRLTDTSSSPADAVEEEGPDEAEGVRHGKRLPHNLERAGLLGEYSGIAVRAGRTVPVWTDTRHGNQDTYATVTSNISAVPNPTGGRRLLSLQAWPNPSTGGAEIRLRLEEGRKNGVFTVVDLQGRELRRIEQPEMAAGETTIAFDGRDSSGQPLPPGVYWVKMADGPSTKMVILQGK